MRNSHKVKIALGGIMLAALVQACRPGEEVELSLLHTNDLHYHYRASKTDPFGLGGMARLSTKLKQLREAAPLTLTLDAGDWSEGSWYYSLDTGASMLRLMDMLKYDAIVLGNHDFLAAPKRTGDTIAEAQISFPVLAANLDMSRYEHADELRARLPRSVVKQVGQLKVGIIGLTTFEFVYDSYMKPVKILNPIETATKEALELRSKVDVLLIISHNNFEVNKQVAKLVPGVDAVVSGHSHKKVPRAEIVKNAGRDVPVVETGEWGKFLGELRLGVNVGNRKVRVKHYQLHPITSDIVEDPVVAAYVEAQDHALSQKMGDDVHRKIATADFDLHNHEGVESALGNLAVKSYREATQADVAIEHSNFLGVGLARGDLTLMDLHDVMPHIYDVNTGKEWMLHVWDARGSDLALVIQAFYTINGMTPFSLSAGWLLLDNAVVIWDPARLQEDDRADLPVKSIQIAGAPLDPSRRYKVALTEGLLFGIRTANDLLHLGIDLSIVQSAGMQGWEAVVRYAASVSHLPLDELRTGKRLLASGADLALNDYAMDWDGQSIRIQVENHGLTATPVAKLRCSSGVPNDPIVHDTELQTYTEIATATVPALASNGTAGSSATLLVPFEAAALVPGFWPVKCEILSEADSYERNNLVEKVFSTAL